MQSILAYTFLISCVCFIVVPVLGYTYETHKYPSYKPSYGECLSSGLVVTVAILGALLFSYALLWSITILGA